MFCTKIQYKLSTRVVTILLWIKHTFPLNFHYLHAWNVFHLIIRHIFTFYIYNFTTFQVHFFKVIEIDNIYSIKHENLKISGLLENS